MTGLGDPLKRGKMTEMIFLVVMTAIAFGGIGALVRWLLLPAQIAAQSGTG